MSRRMWSTRGLAVFAPILIAVGVLGFILPADKSLTSGAPAYNVFHLAFGTLGALCLGSRKPTAIRGFLIGFGVIDLYQALASKLDLFPKEFFRWTPVDDVLHLLVGALLVALGVWGDRVQPGG